MNNKTLLIAKKEWDRFFGDRRMVISALIFPGVLYYIVFAFFAPFIINMSMRPDGAVTVYAINPPDVIQMVFEQTGIELTLAYEDEKEKILKGIAQNSGNFLIVFPEDFIEEAFAFDAQSGEIAPEVFLYYNSLSEGHAGLYGIIVSSLFAFERSVARKFDINLTGGGDMAAAGAPGQFLFAMLLPMFLLLFIFHGAMATTTEGIAGEKERGTFATIFITSITPMELSAGKILGLGIESLLCGIFGALGVALALPRFIDSFASLFAVNQELSSMFEFGMTSIRQYSIGDFGILLLLLLATSCLIVTIIAIISIHAKTAKEAKLLITPMLIVILFIGSMNIFHDGGENAAHLYLIPIYNSVQSMGGIFSQNYSPANVAAAIGANIFLAALGCFVLSRLIKTEKIMVS